MELGVGVFGATGYTGQEALRLVRRHPQLRAVFSTGSDGGHLAHAEGLQREADAYLLCLPHGISGSYAARLRAERPQATIIDLSGDLRLPNAAEYQHWYGEDSSAPELLGQAVYGLSEVHRERLRGARLISNPGCYATAALLSLAPLLKAGLAEADDIVIDAKSGVTGAGRTPREDLLFAEVADNFSAYAAGRTHRHVGEIEAALESQAGREVRLTFSPHLLPVRRGILSAAYVRTRASAVEIAAALSAFYSGSPFVRIQESLPRLSDVVGTNLCRLAVRDGAAGRAIVFAAIDNLLKGAAGQAIQNLNLAVGFAEAAGLPGVDAA